MCVNEAGSIRLMEEKDVEQVEELEKTVLFLFLGSEKYIKRRAHRQFDTTWYGKKTGS